MSTEPGKARRIAVVSGKGGVGKTVITANLAASLSLKGSRILVVDADLGLANLDILLGVSTEYTLLDVLHGNCRVDDILLRTRNGFDLLPAGSGLPEGTVLTQVLAEGIESILGSIENRYEIILFDAGAGVGDVVLFFANLADDVLLVVTPEPTSLMDSYAIIKILNQTHQKGEFLMIVNQVSPDNSSQIADSVIGRLENVISQFINVEGKKPVRLELMGSIPLDPAVPHAIRRRQLLSEISPKAPSVFFLDRFADYLHSYISN